MRVLRETELNVSELALKSLLLLLDATAIFLTVVGVHAAYHYLFIGGPVTIGGVAAGVLISFTFGVFQLLSRAYVPIAYLNRGQSLRSAAIAWCCVFFMLGWLAFLLKVTDEFSRASLSASFVVGFAVLVAVRAGAASSVRYAINGQRLVLSRVFIIHDLAHNELSALSDQLRARGAKVVGSLGLANEASSADHRPELSLQIEEAYFKQGFEEIHLLLPWHEKKLIMAVVTAVRHLPVRVMLLPDPELSELFQETRFGPGPHASFEIQKAPLSPGELAIKRSFDIVVSGLALLFLMPLLVLVGLAVRTEGQGPIIFRQQRKGFGSRPFTIYKIRTMQVLEDGDVILQATRNDPRVTRVGAILRRTSIDELPQLWNVLKGDMSIVGPRPHAVAHDNQFDELIETYAHRRRVKPGLTGWAQVNGCRGETKSVHSMAERVSYDLWYIENWSLWLDFKILARTFIVAVSQKNAY